MAVRAAGIYLVAACVLTWPLATQMGTSLGAVEGAGDPYLNLWILGWGMQAWLSDPIGVFTGRVFDANIFFPATGTLTYSDHLLLQSLVLSPLYWLTGSLALCYNVLLMASLALSGMAMHLLARTVTGSSRAAFIAGLAWACWPYRTAHLLHLQLQGLYFLPLVLWALVRIAAAGQRRDTIRLGLFAALQAISSVYYGVMTALMVGVAAVALAWTTGQWRSRRFWSRVAAAAVLGAVLMAPVAWRYFLTQQREGFGRDLFEAARHSATIQSYTQVPHENLIYGRSGLLLPRPPAAGEVDRRDNEHQMFPGIVLLVLAGVGVWKGWRCDSRPVVATGLALAAVGVALSLGPLGARDLYAWIADHVFGFQAIRAPARFAVVATVGWCLLAAVAVHRIRPRGAVFAVLLTAMMAEYANAPLPLVDAPPATTRAGAWLGEQPGRDPVLYLPLTVDKENSVFMVRSLEHRRPIVNGYSGQRPAFFTALVDAFADPASLDARATLKELGVRYVVSQDQIAGADQPDSPYVERETFGDDIVYEVGWTEQSDAALGDGSLPAPPALGAVPFAEGETARYSVEWLSGPLDLSAGTITLAVVRPEAADTGLRGQRPAHVFEATAETAPWLSRFFEARNRYRTSVDAALLPLTHRRFVREGRRSFNRAYTYDHDGRRVRMGDTTAPPSDPGALALPLAAHARDALAALWYVRALPLEPGLTFDMPINEAGRNQVARVVVAGRENIAAFDGVRPAFRLEPALAARVQRRQAVTARIWLSADAKQVPLLVEIEAGFGRLRLKLVDYRP